MASDEDALPAHAVGQPPERDGQEEVDDVGANEEEREPRRGEVVALLQGQVEETVADRQER